MVLLKSSSKRSRAQATQFAVPLLGLPAIAVPTGMAVGSGMTSALGGAPRASEASGPSGSAGVELPMGIQLIGPRFREDLLLDAAAVIEARCSPMTPVDPKW